MRSNKKLIGTKKVDFSPNQTVCVLQHEYAVTNAKASKNVLGAWGAGPCIILALYDSKNKVVVLTHVSHYSQLNSLTELFQHIDPATTVAHLTGGIKHNDIIKLHNDLVGALSAKKITIKNDNTLQQDLGSIQYNPVTKEVRRVNTSSPASRGASLAIHAVTGDIYELADAFSQMNITAEVRQRISALKMRKEIKMVPLTEVFNSKIKILERKEEKPRSSPFFQGIQELNTQAAEHYKNGRFALAKEGFEKILTHWENACCKPDAGKAEQRNQAIAQANLGKTLKCLRQFEAALDHLTKARAFFPEKYQDEINDCENGLGKVVVNIVANPRGSADPVSVNIQLSSPR